MMATCRISHQKMEVWSQSLRKVLKLIKLLKMKGIFYD
jgi:hypothetical protein